MAVVKYRIPGEKSVSLSGTFVKLEESTSPSGFFYTNFTGSEVYVLEVGDVPETSLFYSHERPMCIPESEYLALAKEFISSIEDGTFEKLVLSRIVHVELFPDPFLLFDYLTELYPKAFVYMLSSPESGTWIGATPEVLIKGENSAFHTMALAGTKVANDDSPWRRKEVAEQLFVSSFIETALKSSGAESVSKEGPIEKKSGPVKHLCTDFAFTYHGKLTELIAALHPTPAVAGVPRDKSASFIETKERHKRMLYTGIIGIGGTKTNLFVNLRCMQMTKEGCFLYVGGGLTELSDPLEELEETKNKARVLLNAIEKLSFGS